MGRDRVRAPAGKVVITCQLARIEPLSSSQDAVWITDASEELFPGR